MDNYLIAISQQSLYLCLLLTAAPVGLALIVGLIISLIQATTQLQEQTLTFVPKLVAVGFILVLAGPWMLSKLVNFSAALMNSITTYVH